MILADPYGRFVPGPARGLPQYVTATGLVEGDLAAPVRVPANTLHFDTPFLTDIAHHADPTPVDSDHTRPPPGRPAPDEDPPPARTCRPAGRHLRDELLGHYIAGTGGHENIG